MTTTPGHRPAAATGARAALGAVIDRLEENLNGQLALAEREDFEALSRAAEEAGELLAEAGRPGGPLSAQEAARLSAVLEIHHRIGLILAAKHREVMQQLAGGCRGKQLLKAYRMGPE